MGDFISYMICTILGLFCGGFIEHYYSKLTVNERITKYQMYLNKQYEYLSLLKDINVDEILKDENKDD